MSDCPRCQQDENYGCGCSTLELLDYAQDRVAELEAKLADAYAEALEAAAVAIVEPVSAYVYDVLYKMRMPATSHAHQKTYEPAQATIRALPNPYRETE